MSMRVRPACPVGISGGFLLLYSVLFFLDDGHMLPHFMLACLVHELGHFIVLRIVGGRVARVYLRAAGAELHLRDPAGLSYQKELAAVLAGPAAGLLLAFSAAQLARRPGWEELYVLGGLSLALSLFNLLPVRALDGGQAIYLLLCFLLDPARAEAATWVISLAASFLAAAAGTAACVSGAGCALLIAAVLLAAQSLRPSRRCHPVQTEAM